MESVLHGSKNSKVFIDDILVFSSCMQEHVKDLREVFMRLRKANLTL